MNTTHDPTPSGVSAPRFPSLQWWIRDRDGEVAIAQPPNPALVVWLVTAVVGWTHLLDDRRNAVIGHVGQGALAAWALDELLRGSSPVRRLLGAVVLVVVLWRILG